MKKSVILCALLCAVVIIAGIIFSQTWYEIAASVLANVYILFYIKKKRFALLCGSVFFLLNGIVAVLSRLWATAGMSFLYLLPITLITFFKWGKSREVTVKSLSPKGWIKALSSLAVLIAVFFIVLTATSGSQPFLDAVSFSLTMLAGALMIFGFREIWIVNIVTSFFTISLWTINIIIFGTGVTLLLTQIISLGLSIYGLILWRRQAV